VRHLGAGLAIPDFPLAFGRLVPPQWDAGILVHYLHRVWAVVVAALALWLAARVEGSHAGEALLRRPALNRKPRRFRPSTSSTSKNCTGRPASR